MTTTAKKTSVRLRKLKRKVSDYSRQLGFIPNRAGGYYNDAPTTDDVRYLLNNCYSACVPTRKFHE